MSATVDELRKTILAYKVKVEQYVKEGRDEEAERKWIEVQKLERKLEKEEAKLPTHPALVFGPIAQTVAIMAAISLGMSVSPLPYEMYPFFRLFSSVTTLAVLCLVVRSSIVWVEYHKIISSLPSLASKDDYKEASFADWLKDVTTKIRPDDWQHSRAHPSHFLTTRHAAPKLFPFPLGKTRPDVSVAEELWWEGGNAPHVGHFNKPPAGMAQYPGPALAQKLLERAKKKMEHDDKREMWKKRIRSIQILSIIAIVSFISRKVAVIALIYLVYTTLSSEIDSMLKPTKSAAQLALDKELQYKATQIQRVGAPAEPPKSKTMAQGVQGMGYVYQTNDSGRLDKANVALPIVTVAPHVLMTSQSRYLTGFGEKIKGENRRLG